MNWDDLKIVLAVARGGSMSAAARTLSVNQTTISRRLVVLEKEMGVSLFLRSNAACRLTEAGDRLVRHAERMESEITAIGEDMEQIAHQPYGPVRIATMPWLFHYLIVPALPSLRAKYPGISILAYAGLRARHLGKREAEMSLRFEERPRSQEECIPICRFDYSLYAPVGVDPERLPWVGFAEESVHTATEIWLEQNLKTEDQVAFQANDAGIVYQSVRAGLGKGLIPDVLAARDPTLRRLSGKKPEITRELRILVRKDMSHIARVSAVIRWLKKYAFVLDNK